MGATVRPQSHQVRVGWAVQREQGLAGGGELAGEGFGLAAGGGVGDEDSLGEVGHEVVALGRGLRRRTADRRREGRQD